MITQKNTQNLLTFNLVALVLLLISEHLKKA